MQDLSKLPEELRPLYEDLYKSQTAEELIQKSVKIELAAARLSAEKRKMEEAFLENTPMGIHLKEK